MLIITVGPCQIERTDGWTDEGKLVYINNWLGLDNKLARQCAGGRIWPSRDSLSLSCIHEQRELLLAHMIHRDE